MALLSCVHCSGRMLAAATLEQQLQEEAPRRRVNWGKPSNIAGIILSVLVSLAGSLRDTCCTFFVSWQHFPAAASQPQFPRLVGAL